MKRRHLLSLFLSIIFIFVFFTGFQHLIRILNSNQKYTFKSSKINKKSTNFNDDFQRAFEPISHTERSDVKLIKKKRISRPLTISKESVKLVTQKGISSEFKNISYTKRSDVQSIKKERISRTLTISKEYVKLVTQKGISSEFRNISYTERSDLRSTKQKRISRPLTTLKGPQVEQNKRTEFSCAVLRLLNGTPIKRTDNTDICSRFEDLIPNALLRYAVRAGDEELCALLSPLFTRRKLVIWTSDHHSAPVLDLRSLLEPLGVEFIDHTVFHNCDYFCHCAGGNSVSVLNSENVGKMSPELMSDFWKAYPPEHQEITRVDAFASFFCFSQFEMFRPYNKSIIAIAPIRFEFCRTPRRWSELLGNVTELSGKPHHVIGANNQYDREYIRYFTNVEPHLLPGFCVYTGAHYNPTHDAFLLNAQRGGLEGELLELWTSEYTWRYSNVSARFELLSLREVVYNYENLASHLGVVHIPYQVSTMSVFEQYRMCIPLFFPSHALLVQWNVRYRVLYDRTTAMKWGFSNASDIPPHPARRATPDPNNEGDLQSQRYWLWLADGYTLEHITYFDSVAALVDMLHNMTRNRLLAISNAMDQFNRSQLKQLLRFWRSHLLAIARYSPNRPS